MKPDKHDLSNRLAARGYVLDVYREGDTERFMVRTFPCDNSLIVVGSDDTGHYRLAGAVR